MKRVLFICVGNSARSQMAEAFLNHLAGGQVVAASAGTRPARSLAPEAIAVMAELGIDISAQQPKPLSQEMLQQADRVIALGHDVAATSPFPSTSWENWAVEDLRGQPLEQFRAVRDQIRKRVLALLAELSEGHSAETM